MSCLVKKHVPHKWNRGERLTARYVACGVAGLILILLTAGAAAAQTPVYTVTQTDAVTGGNPTRTFNIPRGSCTNCYIPDPNPASGVPVDNYSQDIYERPTSSGSSANTFFAALDITSGQVGFDDTWLYYRINLYGVDFGSGNLPFYYSFEINFDADNKGDIVVEVASPSTNLGTTFGTSGVIAHLDQNNSIGGAAPTLPNGPGGDDGYEFKAFDQGSNNLPGAPGGNNAIRARIVPGTPNSVELAVNRAFLTAANGGGAALKASFRPWASKGATNPSTYYLHDTFGRNDGGSPYPYLRLAGAPASCPNGNDATLTIAQRDALESGTDTPTSPVRYNPCYPTQNIYEIDNGGNVSDFAAGTTIQFFVNLSGTIFEDVNYGGGTGRSLTASLGVARPTARVELYNATGGYVSAVTSNASGLYTFANQPAQKNYTVRVVNSTVSSSRPGYTAANLAVQTFRTDAGTGSVVVDTARVGGETPRLADAGNGSNGAPANDLAALTTASATAQSITPVTAGTFDLSGMDFGFNFDTLVNKNDAGQGSLRQFITNSNTLTNSGLNQAGLTAGVETSVFMLSDGAARPGLRAGLTNLFVSGAATIVLASALPNITDANTAVNGMRQTAVTGDTNAAVSETTTGPEIILDVAAGPGLQTTAANTLFDGLGIMGANGAATIGSGVYFNGAAVAGSIIRNSTLWSNDASGITLRNGATNVQILNSIIRNNGVTDTGADGIELIGASAVTISGNQTLNNAGYGIDLHTTTNDNNSISNNLIKNNGFSAADQDAGIGLRLGSNNTFTLNTITANQGDGIVVVAGMANRISQNMIHANGDLGIDLGGGNSGNGVTINDSADADTGANDLLNFPVLTEASLSAGNLVLKGFARPSVVIEFFIAAPDPTGFGEGQTYLVTLTEGSAADTDPTTGAYTSPVGGHNVGADTTNKFQFTIALPGGVGLGTILTTTATLTNSTSEFSGTFTVANPSTPPDVDLLKSMNPPDGSTQLPGTDLNYTITFTNDGGATAQTLVIDDPMPANTDFKLNSVVNNLGTTGLTVLVAYSNDGGTTYAYTPTDGAGGAPAGYDRTVTHIRWSFTGNFSPTVPNNTGSVGFTVRIR